MKAVKIAHACPLVLVARGPETDSNEERYCVLCVRYT